MKRKRCPRPLYALEQDLKDTAEELAEDGNHELAHALMSAHSIMVKQELNIVKGMIQEHKCEDCCEHEEIKA